MEEFFIRRPFFEDKKPFTQFLYFLLLVMAGYFGASIIGVLLKIIFYAGVDITTSKSYIFIYQAISSIGIFLFPALCFSYFAYRDVFVYNETKQTMSGSQAAWVCFLSLCIVPVVGLLGYFNDQVQLPESMVEIERWMRMMEDQSNELVEFLLHAPTFWTITSSVLVMAILPAICEEYFFRGTLQPFLAKWTKNEHLAIWLTAFIFSAIHLQFYGFIPRFLLGAYLGYLFYWSGSIWLPVLAHFLHNALTVILFWISERKGMDMENTNPFEVPGFIPIILVSALVLGMGLFMLGKQKTRGKIKKE